MATSKDKCYTVYDVIRRGHMLEPLVCVHCQEVGEVTYSQVIEDGLCGLCGRWQLESDPAFNLTTEDF